MQTPIFIVSGGKGLPANSIVQSILVQFPENRIPVKIIPDVLEAVRLREVVKEVKEAGGIIVHTMVDQRLRDLMKALCLEEGVKQFDMMGDLFSYLTTMLKQEPINEPGLFRKMNLEYFDRVESIEYTIASDDGLNPRSVHDADIVLTGISRTGKTPTSIYLAMLGWKVANIPLVRGTEPPGDLFRVDPRRVFGLDITTSRLVSHRLKRLSDFGVSSSTSYTDPREIRRELDYAQAIFKRGGFTVIKVTNKPVESVANEIIGHLSGRFDERSRKVGKR